MEASKMYLQNLQNLDFTNWFCVVGVIFTFLFLSLATWKVR